MARRALRRSKPLLVHSHTLRCGAAGFGRLVVTMTMLGVTAMIERAGIEALKRVLMPLCQS